MKKIVVTIDKMGGSSVEAFGFTGGACLSATKDIEDALGKVDKRKMKPEAGGTVEQKQEQKR